MVYSIFPLFCFCLCLLWFENNWLHNDFWDSKYLANALSKQTRVCNWSIKWWLEVIAASRAKMSKTLNFGITLFYLNGSSWHLQLRLAVSRISFYQTRDVLPLPWKSFVEKTKILTKKALAWNRRRQGTMENFANRLELIWINSRLDQKSSFDPIVCIVQYIGWVILRKSLAGLIHIWLKLSNKWCKTWMWANQGIFHSPWLHYGITASNSMHKFTVKSRLYGLVQRNKLKTMIESIELGFALATVNDSWSFILFSPTVLIYA